MEARTLLVRPEFFTVKEAAIYLNLSEKSVRRYATFIVRKCAKIFTPDCVKVIGLNPTGLKLQNFILKGLWR
jgi:hypothetical protein